MPHATHVRKNAEPRLPGVTGGASRRPEGGPPRRETCPGGSGGGGKRRGLAAGGDEAPATRGEEKSQPGTQNRKTRLAGGAPQGHARREQNSRSFCGLRNSGLFRRPRNIQSLRPVFLKPCNALRYKVSRSNLAIGQNTNSLDKRSIRHHHADLVSLEVPRVPYAKRLRYFMKRLSTLYPPIS